VETPEEREELLKTADEWVAKAMQIKKDKAAQAAKTPGQSGG